MISRYTLPRMGEVWTEQHKFQTWLEVELLACEAWEHQARVPHGTAKRIRQKAEINVARIEEIEVKTRHDLIAFVESISEQVGEDGRHLHLGLTSYDIEDTALAMRMREAVDIIAEDLEALQKAVKDKARKHRDTLMPGRTHGVHAEPISFGLKMALWHTEVGRSIERLKQTRKRINCGKISGAVGNFAHCPPEIEEYVLGKLKMTPAEVSTQIVQRDRHAELLMILALIGASLEKFATEIRNLQRTEIGEVQEGFSLKTGQKGSSAMPHKKNPIVCERISGLARILRGNAVAALQNVALWHERDLTNSAPERIIIPDSCILVDYMLQKFTDVIKGLIVNEDKMRQNIELSRGAMYSQRVLLVLIERGLSREKAYEIVQSAAMKGDLLGNLGQDTRVTDLMSPEQIRECFAPDYYLRHVEDIFKRAGID